MPTIQYFSLGTQKSALPLITIFFFNFFFQPTQAGAQCGAPIVAFPYYEDFEASQGGWSSGGIANDWAWGKPGKPTINTAASGINCWITGGLTGAFYGFGQRSYVESPCFDFTQLAHPYIHFKIWWESERQYDGASFQLSIDNGATWDNVGAANEPVDCLNDNWFNSSTITNLTSLASPRHGWSGNIGPTAGSCQGGNGSNGWVIAKHCLTNLAGKPNVRFRFVFGAGTTCNDFDGVAFDDIYIENAPPVAPDFSSDCAGNNTYAFTDLSTNCPDNWQWNFGDPASGASNTSNLQNPLHTFSVGGIYTITLQASSNCSGASSITFPIEVLELNTIITKPSCYGGNDGSASVLIDPTAGNPGYSWNTAPPQFGATATNLTAGNYTVTVTATGFCPVATSVIVSQPDSSLMQGANLIQAISDTTIALGNAVSLTGIVSDPGRIISYKWEPALYLDCDTCLNTLASPLQTITYVLFAKDSIGCVISDELILQVLPGSVYIPNVFKPSSDQLNSHFTVYADKDVERVELMQIYDRWGSLIFERQHFQASEASIGWDGRTTSGEVSIGVYVYVVKVRFVNGLSVLYKGNVAVIW